MTELMRRRRALMGAKKPEQVNEVLMPFTTPETIINMSNGAASGNKSWYATDFVEIPSGFSEISFTNTYPNHVSFRGAFYNDSKGFVVSSLTSVWSISPGATESISIPNTAKYIRLSTNASILFNQIASMQLVK